LKAEISSSVVRLSRAPVSQSSRRYLRHSAFPGGPQLKKYTFDTASDTIRDVAEQRPAAASRFRLVFKEVTSSGYPIDLASCQNATTSSPNTVGFFMAVISTPGYFDKREVIRKGVKPICPAE
jgi:hypothetical protein